MGGYSSSMIIALSRVCEIIGGQRLGGYIFWLRNIAHVPVKRSGGCTSYSGITLLKLYLYIGYARQFFSC